MTDTAVRYHTLNIGSKSTLGGLSPAPVFAAFLDDRAQLPTAAAAAPAAAARE